MNKSTLCRLKQAPFTWNSKITHRLHKMGFVVLKSDSSLFIRKGPNGLVSILLYVDDLVVTCPDLAEISQVNTQLSNAFKMKDLGNLHYFLRIEVIHTTDGILLTQRHYVLNMLYKFRMTDCLSVSTPPDRNLKLRPDLGASCNKKRLRQVVGSLIYLMITRPDLSYLVSMISQFMLRASNIVICEWHKGLRTNVSARHSRTASQLYWCRLGWRCHRSMVDIRFYVLSWERGCSVEQLEVADCGPIKHRSGV